MGIKKGWRCLLSKTCIRCNTVYHGKEFQRGTGDVCRKCRKEKMISKAKRKRDEIEPSLLQEKMKKWRETALDIAILKPNKEGEVTIMCWNLSSANQIDYEKAVEMVRNGEAQVYSEDTIYHLNGELRNEYLNKVVLRRDNHVCYYCKGYGDTIDHIQPLSKGGLSTLENMVCACEKCNGYKGNDKTIEETIVGVLTTKEHREIKIKELKADDLSFDDMLNNVLTNKKNKWE